MCQTQPGPALPADCHVLRCVAWMTLFETLTDCALHRVLWLMIHPPERNPRINTDSELNRKCEPDSVAIDLFQ